MGIAHLIGPGEREWFRRCRRAWDLGSPNRRNLERRAAPPVADIGRAVRSALAVWYFPGMWEWPRAIVLPRALQAFDEGVAGKPEPEDGAVDAARRMLERYFTWAPTVDAFTPVRVEADFEANIPDVHTPGQDLVDGDGRPVRFQDRLPLLIVDAHDTYWVVEHRLAVDGWADRDELLLAERPVAGAWGWEQFYLGMVIAGTVHNELRVDGDGRVGDEPGEGRPVRRPRSRDWARSRAASRADPAGQATRSSVIHAGSGEAVVQEGGEWFRRTWIRRSRAEVDTVGEHLCAEALDMLDPDLALFPSPVPEHCGRCAYRAPCLAMNQGTDVGTVLAADYQRRDPNRPPEGRLGGGTWSMNRGAAPPPQWRSPPPR